MANSDNVAGFRVVGTKSGAGVNHALRRCFIPSSDSTAYAVGDLVLSAGSADTDGEVPTVVKATAGDAIRGVIVGFEPDPDGLSSIYRAASTNRYCWVNEDPNILLACQEDSVGGALAATDVGNNIDLTDAGVDTTRGTSGMELDSSTAATTNTLSLRLEKIVPRPDNALGTNAEWIVSVNLHEFRNVITGV